MTTKRILIGQDLASRNFNIGVSWVKAANRIMSRDNATPYQLQNNLQQAMDSINLAILCYKDALDAKPNKKFNSTIIKKMDGLLNSQMPFIHRQLKSANKLM